MKILLLVAGSCTSRGALTKLQVLKGLRRPTQQQADSGGVGTCVRCMNAFVKLLRNHSKVFWHTSAPLLSFLSAANWHHK